MRLPFLRTFHQPGGVGALQYVSHVKAWKHACLFVSFGGGSDDDDDCGGGDEDDDGDDGDDGDGGGDGVTCAVLVTSGERSDGGGGEEEPSLLHRSGPQSSFDPPHGIRRRQPCDLLLILIQQTMIGLSHSGC